MDGMATPAIVLLKIGAAFTGIVVVAVVVFGIMEIGARIFG